MKIAEVLAIGVLLLVLTGGSIAWIAFVRGQDRERREREKRLAEKHEKEKTE